MTIRGLVFIGFFGVASVVALSRPFAGVCAYVFHYHSYPENSWWGSSLSTYGVRYSFIISACLAVGTLRNLKRLPYGRLLTGQEKLYLIFLGWVVLTRLMNGMQSEEDAVDKMIKVAVFLLCLTHIVVTPQRWGRFTWLMICCGIYLGWECNTAPQSRFNEGRLEGVGGPDFGDANAMAAHLVALLSFIGVQFLRAGWKGKLVCLMAGGMVANSVVLTRSRGGYLATIVAVLVMAILAPQRHRRQVLSLLLIGALGALVLVDSKFMERMGTIQAGEREKDESAMSRLRFWKAGFQMAIDHPLGVGPGNFYGHIGDYLPEDAGRDTHNTYVRCLAELGWPGLGLLLVLMVNAHRTLARIRLSTVHSPGSVDCDWSAFGLQIGLASYQTAAIFISAIYIEMFWWMLLLPAALERAAANAVAGETT